MSHRTQTQTQLEELFKAAQGLRSAAAYDPFVGVVTSRSKHRKNHDSYISAAHHHDTSSSSIVGSKTPRDMKSKRAPPIPLLVNDDDEVALFFLSHTFISIITYQPQ